MIEVTTALAASFINLAAVVFSGDPTALFAALSGASLLLAVLVIRKATSRLLGTGRNRGGARARSCNLHYIHAGSRRKRKWSPA